MRCVIPVFLILSLSMPSFGCPLSLLSLAQGWLRSPSTTGLAPWNLLPLYPSRAQRPVITPFLFPLMYQLESHLSHQLGEPISLSQPFTALTALRAHGIAHLLNQPPVAGEYLLALKENLPSPVWSEEGRVAENIGIGLVPASFWELDSFYSGSYQRMVTKIADPIANYMNSPRPSLRAAILKIGETVKYAQFPQSEFSLAGREWTPEGLFQFADRQFQDHRYVRELKVDSASSRTSEWKTDENLREILIDSLAKQVPIAVAMRADTFCFSEEKQRASFKLSKKTDPETVLLPLVTGVIVGYVPGAKGGRASMALSRKQLRYGHR